MNKGWRRLFALLWLAIISLAGIYDAQALLDHGKIKFDLLALLPQGKGENMRLSNELMDDGNISGRIVIAFGHENPEQAKGALTQFREHIQATALPFFEHNVKHIETSYKTLFTHLYPFRAGMLSKEDRQHLIDGSEDLVLQSAISNILSPFGSFDSNQISTDPFGFYPRYVTSLGLGNGAQTDADGDIVLFSKGKYYFIYQGEVTEKIFSLKFQEKISNALQLFLLDLENKSGVEVLRVGAVFYSTAGAQQAQSEISQIGLLSTIGILFILLLVFRVSHPIIFAFAVVSSGLLCGLAVCLYLYGSIHILALLFGCSLVGIAVDYALHYYCASFQPVDRFKVLSLLLPAMPLGVLTSAIGYGALAVAPFPGIQQMAILACIGLLTTFVSVALWGPYFIKNGERKIPRLAEQIQYQLEHLAEIGSIKYLKLVLSASLLLCFCAGALIMKFDDNVRNFQSLDPVLKVQEERIKEMMNFDNSTKFLAVQGHDFDGILQTEEAITQELDKKGISYRSLSELIPSQKRQLDNCNLKLHFCHSRFPEIASMLGIEKLFSPSEAGFEPKPPVVDGSLMQMLPSGWKELIHVSNDGLLTGRIIINGKVNACEYEGYEGCTYVDPVREYSSLFSSYREIMMLLTACLLLGFMLIMSIRQGLKASFNIISPVLLSMLTTIGIIGLFSTGFSMFHAMGLILVLCIGIDYSVFLFWRRPEEKELLLLGNTLAATTTILSFGLLALSNTTAVHSFGMTVLVGILLNFLITTLFLGNKK